MPPDLGARLEQVLAVVQDQQHPPRPQRVAERLEQRAPGLLGDPGDRRDTRDHLIGLPQLGQLDEPDPIRELFPRGGALSGDHGQQPEGEPGFADPAGAAQGQRAGPAQQLAQLAKLPFPADKAIRFLGQMCLDFFHVNSSGTGVTLSVNLRCRLPGETS